MNNDGAKVQIGNLIDEDDEEAPYIHNHSDTVGFLGRITYSYVSPMLMQAYQKGERGKPMSLHDCFVLSSEFAIEKGPKRLRQQLDAALDQQQGKRSLLAIILRAYPGYIWKGAVFRILSDCISFVSPIIVRLIINFLKDPTAASWQGFLWVGLLVVSQGLLSVMQNKEAYYNYSMAQNVRNGIMIRIFEKTLQLQTVESTGNLIQLHSTDCSKIIEASNFMHFLWSGPLLILAFIVQLYFYVGWAGVVGFGVMLVFVPLQSRISTAMMSAKREALKNTVERVQATNEALLGIRICKFMSWESNFTKRIDDKRRVEMSKLLQVGRLRMFMMSLMLSAPIIVQYVIFVVALKLQGELKSADVFPALAVLNSIRHPLLIFPISLGRVIDTVASLRRVGLFLATPVKPCTVKRSLEVTSEKIVDARGVSMQYRVPMKAERPEELRVVLRDTTVEIQKGSLTLIMGPTGSGKTTFLHGLLGEGGVETSGDIMFQGRVSYSAQEAWIMNATLRKNIIMGLAFDEERYNDVIRVCQLNADLDQLPDGDNTEIGEKGINLSGGQKQRVSLARAVYAQADVYVFDDPLSAVDAHVSHGLVHQCLLTYLNDKTRILVTHQTQYMPFAHRVISIQNCRISITDNTEPQPAERQNSPFAVDVTATEIDQHVVISRNDDMESSPIKDSSSEERKAAGILVKKETMEVGTVKWSIFLYYLSTMRFFVALLIVGAYMLFQSGKQLGDLWVSWWAEGKLSMSDDDYKLWWGLTTIGTVILAYARQDILMTAQLLASQTLHNRVLARIIKAPTSYFDVTPLGRIMTVFTRDFDTIDGPLPDTLSWFNQILFNVAGMLILMMVATPYITIVFLLGGILYWKIYNFYSAAMRALKRLDGVYRAPVLSLMTETTHGLTSIRACGLQAWASHEHDKRLKNFARPQHSIFLVTRWLSVRLELLGNMVVCSTALLAVIQKVTTDRSGGSSLNVSVLGLSVVYALIITGGLSPLTRFAGEVEASMNSIERMKTAAEDIPQEREVEYSSDPMATCCAPHPSWPLTGHIELRECELRYRDGLPLVLKGVSCVIPSGSRVGIVGRTGSGKSTLLLALFRIVELASGSILLDGRDIATLKMNDLREKITVIPQDPVLFEGTVRSNLDPFHEYTDDAIWAALKKVNLEGRVQSEKGKLRALVKERGANFSVGQRQLICMARALLKKCRVLLMDEATASLDNHTDALIQCTLRTEFVNVTVLTIAHRLLTVMDSDVIMVLRQGRLVECNSPRTLLADPDGDLARMVATQGPEHAQVLTDVAEGRLKVTSLVTAVGSGPK